MNKKDVDIRIQEEGDKSIANTENMDESTIKYLREQSRLMAEFFMYAPLIDTDKLTDIINSLSARVDRDDFDQASFELEIVEKLRALYADIEDSPEKAKADEFSKAVRSETGGTFNN